MSAVSSLRRSVRSSVGVVARGTIVGVVCHQVRLGWGAGGLAIDVAPFEHWITQQTTVYQWFASYSGPYLANYYLVTDFCIAIGTVASYPSSYLGTTLRHSTGHSTGQCRNGQHMQRVQETYNKHLIICQSRVTSSVQLTSDNYW